MSQPLVRREWLFLSPEFQEYLDTVILERKVTFCRPRMNDIKKSVLKSLLIDSDNVVTPAVQWELLFYPVSDFL